MDGDPEKQQLIIKKLETKAILKQRIYAKTAEVFVTIKDLLHEMTGEINDTLSNTKLIKVEYRDRGKFEAQVQFAGDVLIFSMHTNVFTFDRGYPFNDSGLINQDSDNVFFGMINIYNFLADSFKYNRTSDEGYMIGRIFVNKDKCFFMEGDNFDFYSIKKFGEISLDDHAIKDIIETAMLNAMEFDLFVPPLDISRIVSVEQMNTRTELSKIQTGKRLGYESIKGK